MMNGRPAESTAFLVESNRVIREVKILKCAGGLYTVRFVNGGGGIKVRESRLFTSSEEAKASIKKLQPTQVTVTTHHPTPWD